MNRHKNTRQTERHKEGITIIGGGGGAHRSYLGIEDTMEEEYEEAKEAVEDSKEILIEHHVLVDSQQAKHPGDTQERK